MLHGSQFRYSSYAFIWLVPRVMMTILRVNLAIVVLPNSILAAQQPKQLPPRRRSLWPTLAERNLGKTTRSSRET